MEIFLDFIESFLGIRVSLVDVLNDGPDFLGISGTGCFRKGEDKQQQNDRKNRAQLQKRPVAGALFQFCVKRIGNGRSIFDLISFFPAPCEALLNLSSHHLLSSLYEACIFL